MKSEVFTNTFKKIVKVSNTFTILLMTLAAFSNVAFAQEAKVKETKPKNHDIATKDVPAVVTTKFTALYPLIKDAEWETKGADYVAEFDVNKMETKVVFNAAGDVLKTKVEVMASEFPQAAKDYLKNHPGKKIKKSWKITDGKGVITYKAEIDDDKDTFSIFDSEGKFIEDKVE